MWHIQTPGLCMGDWWHLPVHFTGAGWVSGHIPECPKDTQSVGDETGWLGEGE